MPFDPAPAVEVGPYQEFADALMRGCAVTYPIKGVPFDRLGGACALGAMWLGLGTCTIIGSSGPNFRDERYKDVMGAYYDRYATGIHNDNDSGKFTREQIAARIAALR